ncbi:MAG TPA: carotenoid oxygenase family protein [Gammaproteobacteria bacterium]|nr:carotenoid oxygenase family protein [Gammaproteobacteria bacterium]
MNEETPNTRDGQEAEAKNEAAESRSSKQRQRGSEAGLDRRHFLGAVTLGAGALAAGFHAAPASAATEDAPSVLFPSSPRAFGGGGSERGSVNRSEDSLYDCEVEGRLPADLDGVFHRVGTDPQYPKPEKYQNDIGFDGEGHVSMFRIKDGHVDYKSRYARTQRWKAQHKARRSLYGMYRNPSTDDPSVKGLSRGTANTQLFFHHGKLLVYKEDSPPVTMDPLTLETIDDYYLFGDQYPAKTHTAHPKIDSHTGDMIGFGYSAKGFGSRDIYVYQADAKNGQIKWDAWVQAPYLGMIHDFAVSENYIMFLVTPLAFNEANVKKGGVIWAWDSSLPTYLGLMRRGGDGKDLRWLKGEQTMCTHVMGVREDKNGRVVLDMDGGAGNQFPFFPNVHEPYDPVKAVGNVRRFTADLRRKSTDTYQMQVLYKQVEGVLSRQDDRYHTVPYRYGFINTVGATGSGWAMFDHDKEQVKLFSLGKDVRLAEMSFVPRSRNAGEADGYLIGVASNLKENGRSDLIIADTKDLDAGPIAKVKMPYRVVSQVHGMWTPGYQLESI